MPRSPRTKSILRVNPRYTSILPVPSRTLKTSSAASTHGNPRGKEISMTPIMTRFEVNRPKLKNLKGLMKRLLGQHDKLQNLNSTLPSK
ncbi:hypothetical protein BGZ50_008864, partial [Haplosporangium sp. Z 11]